MVQGDVKDKESYHNKGFFNIYGRFVYNMFWSKGNIFR